MLQSLIGKTDSLDAKSAREIAALIEQYPYCQSLQLMYSMALANIHSTKLNVQVQRTALAMPDRLKLCQMVSNGEYEWIVLMNEIEAQKKNSQNNNPTDDFLLIDRYLEHVCENNSDNLPYNLDTISIPDYELDDSDDTDSDNEPIEDETAALIDNFIEADSKGKLFVPKAEKLPDFNDDDDNDISLKKIREKAFLSESLAKIYVKQHKYEQAIAIFSALNLRYSKKYTYFADQIRYLETILSYQKGEENKQVKKIN